MSKPKQLAVAGLAMFTGASILLADMSIDTFARSIIVYRYRPAVFADQKLQVGLSGIQQALPGSLWYIRMDEADRALLGMDNLSRFVQDTGVRGLDFSGHQRLTDSDLELLFQDPSALQLLKLEETLVTDRAMATVGKLANLEVLELNNRITDRGLSFLSRLAQLKVLRVRSPGITNKSASLLGSLKNLRVLDLRNTQVEDADLKSIASLSLRQLDLGSEVTDRGIGFLSGMTKLEKLDLSQTHITRQGLTVLSRLPAIHTLFLGPSISDADMPAVVPFKLLKRLDLTRAPITDKGGEVLALMTSLEELALSKTQVGDPALLTLSRLPRLRYLEISDTRVALTGFKNIKGFETLEVLSITSSQKLTTADIRPFARFPQLHTLIINGVPLGRSMLGHLRRGTGKRSLLLEWLVPLAEAASDSDIEQALEVASLPAETSRSAFGGFDGLKRIHQAESSLDEIIPAVSNPTSDTVQETEKNFMGEFTVTSESSKKKKNTDK